MSCDKIDKSNSKHFKAANYYSCLVKNVAHDYFLVCTKARINDESEN